MADQPVRPPRRLVTAGRELPPRRDRVASPPPAAAPAAPQASGIYRIARPQPPDKPRPPSRPDPRPMRFVYGAGAVAAMSIMAVGLVQPDWSATAEQAPADDGSAVKDDTSAVAALDANGPPIDQGAKSEGNAANVRVRHVVRYVYLKPGETPPPGATVISPAAPTPRVVYIDSTPRRSGSTTRRSNGNIGNSGSVATQRPAPRATPRPAPRPTAVTTRQSGRHR